VIAALGTPAAPAAKAATAAIPIVLRENEYRMDFVREAVERELKRRERAMTAARRRQSQQSCLALSKVSHGRKRHMPDL
jgi:hypothetical protein